jgi:hypothetical protein
VKGQRLSKGECHEYRGKAAKAAILRRLADYPKAEALATQVCDFYGKYLEYYEDSTLESSHYHIKLQHEPVALQYARIELRLGTPRTAEALMHELLHLHTRVRGYPVGEKFSIPYALTNYADTITAIYPRIVNLLEHELILEPFLDLGFEKKTFLGCLSPAPDYQKLASTARPDLGYHEQIGFSWWCLEYFRHWISTRHWVGDEARIYADSALYWGSKVHPEMKAAAREICKFIDSGSLMGKGEHHHNVNNLLEFMKIPIFTEWLTIQTGSDGEPVTIRLIEKEPKINYTRPLAKASGTLLLALFQADL